MEKKQKSVKFELLNIKDKSEFKKVDMCKIVTIGNNVALSFFQINYQDLSDYIMENEKSEEINGSEFLIPISKIVFSDEEFKKFREQIVSFYIENNNL